MTRLSGRRYVIEMQKYVNKQSKRAAAFRFTLTKGDKDKIAAWNQGLKRVLHVFNVRSVGSVGDLRI